MISPLLIDRVADTTAHRDRDALDRSIVGLLLQVLDARLVSLYRLVGEGTRRRVARRMSLTRDQGEIPADSLADIRKLPALDEKPTWHGCVTNGEVVHVSGSDGISTTLFPVLGERDPVGLLEVKTTGRMQPRDASLVLGILRILKNQISLLDYGERDTLTGLLNRKTFEVRFSKLCQSLRDSPMATATEQLSWLALLDVDHFKAINDSRGHLFGDEVLLLISQIMTHALRGGDQLFRFGGEEFVVVLEEVAPAGAHIAYERVRSSVESYLFPQIGRVTVSLGYTRVLRSDVPATCIERADAALYFAKRNGRNNTRDYESLVAAKHLVAAQGNHGEVELF